MRSRASHDRPDPLPFLIDRRYIFVEQAGCIPSISPSLFPLIAVLVWPLLFNLASLAYLGILFFETLSMRSVSDDPQGLVIYSLWVPRGGQRTPTASPEALTLCRFLRMYISLCIGIVCTSSISLFLLVWIVDNSNISVNSLHHDFQTVYILTADQWSRNPQLRTAVELRWLWVFSSVVLTIGLFPNERARRLLGWLTSVKAYVRTRSATFFRVISMLTIRSERGTNRLQMRYAMELSPCTSPDHRPHPIVKCLRSRLSSVSQHSLLPCVPEPLP